MGSITLEIILKTSVLFTRTTCYVYITIYVLVSGVGLYHPCLTELTTIAIEMIVGGYAFLITLKVRFTFISRILEHWMSLVNCIRLKIKSGYSVTMFCYAREIVLKTKGTFLTRIFS